MSDVPIGETAGSFGPVSSFGTVLRRHRQAVRLTQEELAEQADLSVRAISNMESGRTGRPRSNTCTGSRRRLA